MGMYGRIKKYDLWRCKMSDYRILQKVEGQKYAKGCRIYAWNGNLLLSKSGKILLHMKYRNAYDKIVDKIKVLIKIYDSANQLIDTKEYVYENIAGQPNEFFGQKTIVPIENRMARAVKIKVEKVYFIDGSQEDFTGVTDLVSFPERVKISEVLPSLYLQKQYKKKLGLEQDDIYVPVSEGDIRVCACGEYIISDDNICEKCGNALAYELELLDKESLLFDYFSEENQVEREKEAVAAAEVKNQEAEIENKKERKKDKAKVLTLINNKKCRVFLVALAVFILVVTGIKGFFYVEEYSDFKFATYKRAMTAMETEDYATAYDLLSEIDGYKDSRKLLEGFYYEPVHIRTTLLNGDVLGYRVKIKDNKVDFIKEGYEAPIDKKGLDSYKSDKVNIAFNKDSNQYVELAYDKILTYTVDKKSGDIKTVKVDYLKEKNNNKDKDAKDAKDAEDSKNTKDAKDAEDSKETKDSKDSKNTKDSKETKNAKDTSAVKIPEGYRIDETVTYEVKVKEGKYKLYKKSVKLPQEIEFLNKEALDSETYTIHYVLRYDKDGAKKSEKLEYAQPAITFLPLTEFAKRGEDE